MSERKAIFRYVREGHDEYGKYIFPLFYEIVYDLRKRA